jgi:hypothetical protein
MSYATYDELITRYPQASKWAETQAQVENSFLYFAEAELNGLLASAFTVPFVAPIPAAVTDITIDLAYARKMRSQDPEKAVAIEKAVYDRIQRIKDGDEIILTTTSTLQSESQIWSSTQNYHPVHSMLDAESAYTMVSSEMLTAAEDERS